MEANDQISAALANSGPVSIGNWTFHADILLLECRDNRVKLEPRVGYLLYYLAENAGTPVSRAELADHVWSGLVVGDEALTGAINKLRNAFGDDSNHPEVIKTIPKVGYQLIADVEFPKSLKAGSNPESAANKKLAYAGYAVVGLLVIAGLIFLIDRAELPERHLADSPPDPATTATLTEINPTIAVLPFLNISNDPDQEYLSDGISESLITDLSRLNGLTVVARQSSFTHRNRDVSTEDIGQDLGAKYILDGSVQAEGNGLRISAQLVDAETGYQLWANRFDKSPDNIFGIQDEIAREIIKALSIRFDSREHSRIKKEHPASFEAYDLFLRGQRVSVEFSDETIREAIRLYRDAIKLDPNYARAYGALAVARIRQYLMGFSDTPVMTQDRALELASKAAEIDPTSHKIQWSLGYVHLYRKEFREGEAASKRSIELSSSYADGYSLLALFKNNLGMPAEAIPLIEKAMKLNPHYTWDYIYQLGRANYTLGDYAKAAEYLIQALERNEAAGYPRLFLAAAYVNLGRTDDAEWELELLEASHPEYLSRSYLQKTMPIGDSVLMNRLLQDLETAGLPN